MELENWSIAGLEQIPTQKNHHINTESGSAPVVKASSYPVSHIDA
jgi:hypothetical protein